MDSTCFVISLCMAFWYFVDCGILYFKTNPVAYNSDSYSHLRDYEYPTEGTSLIFQIRVCSSAYIYLMSSSLGVYYQIVVQGWSNTRSEIHRGTSFSSVKDKKTENDLLDCNSYKKFRVSWNNNKISLDKSDSCQWVNMISTTMDGTIQESDISQLAVKTSTYAANSPGHWKFPTADDTIVAHVPASSSWSFLSEFGYDLGTSNSMELNLTACSTVEIGLFKNESSSGLLALFTIADINVTVTSDQGTTLPLPGTTRPCTEMRTFEIMWGSGKIHLYYTDPLTLLHVEEPQDDLDISSIGYKTSSNAKLIWRVNNTGACFAEDVSCDPLPCKNAFTTEMTAAFTTDPTTTTQTIPSTESATTTELTSPVTTEESTTDAPVTKVPTTGEPEQATNALAFTTSQAPVSNECCCISYAQLLIADADLLPALVAKKETNLYKRSMTSAYDDRPSAAFMGYTGSIFLFLIGIGVVVVDLPNLIKMVQLMKNNLRIARMQRLKSTQTLKD